MFGMGTGVTPSLWSPKAFCLYMVSFSTFWHSTETGFGSLNLVKVKSHDRLVRLSFTHHCASTYRLSTLSSSTGLWDVTIRECSS